jgi:hypothetical protein
VVGMVQSYGIVLSRNIYVEGFSGCGKDMMGIVNVIAPLLVRRSHIWRFHVRRFPKGLFSSPIPAPKCDVEAQVQFQVTQGHTRMQG